MSCLVHLARHVVARASCDSLSELLRVSQRLSLALVIRHFLKGATLRGNHVVRIGILLH